VLSHLPIVLTDTIDYWTIGFSHNRPNPNYIISALCFLAECLKRRLYRYQGTGSIVLLCFALFAFSGLCLVYVWSVFLIRLLSCIFQCEPMWMALYSLSVLIWCYESTHSLGNITKEFLIGLIPMACGDLSLQYVRGVCMVNVSGKGPRIVWRACSCKALGLSVWRRVRWWWHTTD